MLEKLTRKPPIESLIDAAHGPFIEVGAVPSSSRDDSLLDLRKIDKRLVTSNIYQPETFETLYKHRITGGYKRVTHRDDAPSTRLYKAVGAEEKMLTTNNRWELARDRIDFIGDATRLPVQDASIGSLYASGLTPSAETDFIRTEAPRALEPGGVLVLDGAKVASLEAESPYFETIELRAHKGERAGILADYAAVRNDTPYQPPQGAK